MNNRKLSLAAFASIALMAGSIPAFAYSGEAYAKDAKITLAQAQNIARAAQPGLIVDTELEKESGGSGLRFSFDVKPAAGGATHEIGIDAMNGKLLENSVDGPNPD